MTAAATAAAWWRNPDALPPSAAARYVALAPMLPSLGGLLVVAVAAGLFARERARYASPVLAWLGKRIGLGGIAALACFVLLPGWPIWGVYAAGGTAAAGAATYVGNLPRRL